MWHNHCSFTGPLQSGGSSSSLAPCTCTAVSPCTSPPCLYLACIWLVHLRWVVCRLHCGHQSCSSVHSHVKEAALKQGHLNYLLPQYEWYWGALVFDRKRAPGSPAKIPQVGEFVVPKNLMSFKRFDHVELIILLISVPLPFDFLSL